MIKNGVAIFYDIASEKSIYMSRRGDHIHKRKDGRWEGRYRSGIKEDGTTAYHSVYGKTYTECKNKLEKNRLNSDMVTSKYKELKFSEILSLWLSSNRVRLKGATENKYLYTIESHILPKLGNKRISKITSSVVNDFLDEQLREGKLNSSGGLSPSYVKTIAIIIEAALKYAVTEGLCQPLKTPIHKPTVHKRELQVLSSDVQKSFEKILIEDGSEVSLGIIIALHTGMRIGEISALMWEDVDFENDVIHIRHTVARVKSTNKFSKTKLIIDSPKTISSKRDIPISSVLKPILFSASKHKKSNYVVSSNNSFMGTRTFDYRYRQLLKSNNISIFNFHTIRHTFATRCIDVGVDVKTLSEILGHSNVSTTLNTYVHPSMEIKKSQIEKLYTSA